jgi:hypothetical protein
MSNSLFRLSNYSSNKIKKPKEGEKDNKDRKVNWLYPSTFTKGLNPIN